MIPKICHFIWSEGVTMSWLQTLTVRSFQKYNPDWDLVIWLLTKSEVKNIYTNDYKGEDYFHTLKDVVIRPYESYIKLHGIQFSDKLRMGLLYKYGGVYSDFDMLWLRPMLEFPQDFETTVCYNDTHDFHYNMSNIVSESGRDFLKEVIEKQDKVTAKTYQAYLTDMFNAEYPDPKMITDKFPRVKMIPYYWFYPYSIFELNKLYKEIDLSVLKDCFGVHWFNGHDLSQEYLKAGFSQCSMTNILRQEGWLGN